MDIYRKSLDVVTYLPSVCHQKNFKTLKMKLELVSEKIKPNWGAEQ
jgi:hypothetical protein